MFQTLELIGDEISTWADEEVEKSQGKRELKELQKLNANNVGERLRDEEEFILFPSSAVLLFSEPQTGDVYLDLACIFWTDPSPGFLKLPLCVWASLKES